MGMSDCLDEAVEGGWTVEGGGRNICERKIKQVLLYLFYFENLNDLYYW